MNLFDRTRATRRATGPLLVVAGMALALLPAAPAEAAGPALRARDVRVTERDGVGLVARVPVRLSRPVGHRVSVDYRTVSRTARAGRDFRARSGTLLFRPGVIRRFVRVPIIGDRVPEGTERFRVRLSKPHGAVVADSVAAVVIVDDDKVSATTLCSAVDSAGPYVRFDGDLARTEGWTANNLFKFSVRLLEPSPNKVCLDWATANGTATAGSDYTGGSGTLVYAPGETVKTVTVAAQGDLLGENDETFFVDLKKAVNARIGTGRATGTILNDDCRDANEGLAAATDLLTIAGDAADQEVRTSEICAGDADWYEFRLVEATSAAVALTARIGLTMDTTPAQTGGDLDLAVYRADGSFVGSSENPGTTPESYDVKKAGTSAVDDTTVYVKVYGAAGTQVNGYTLTVTGGVVSAVAPNLG